MRAFIIGALALALIPQAGTLADDVAKPIGKDVESLPIFDAHIHYKAPAWGPYPPATVLDLMDKNGVAMGLVSSTPDQGTITLWKYAPKRIVPELRPYHGVYGSSNWTKSPEMADYLQNRLDAYPHEGIGEFHVRSFDPEDEPLLRQVAAMAKKRNIYIHIHSGKDPVDLLFSYEPGLKIIWAHAGMSEPPDVIEAMMARYDTLYADTSYREWDILGDGGKIDPDWRRVLERFSDRFMVGSDTWVNSQWESYSELIAANRQWLSQFPRALAEKFAYRNAERLFGRKVEKSLIGTR